MIDLVDKDDIKERPPIRVKRCYFCGKEIKRKCETV